MKERTKYAAQQLVSGRSLAEIGRELGISRQAVQQMICREYSRQTELAKVRPIVNECGVTILKVLRTTLGLTMVEVARGVGMSSSTISFYENGKFTSIEKARRIAEYYGVRVGEVYELPDTEQQPTATG